MGVTDSQSGTRIDEIAEGIYRICTPLPPEQMPGGFSFNRYLIDDEQPLLFHMGLRGMFELTRGAVASVLPPERLRHLVSSHFEADECGAVNQWLAAAPDAAPICGKIGALVSMNDAADRPARALADGEEIALGRHTLKWLATPHLPHAWDCGFMFESHTGTLFCGDLFTQPGDQPAPLTEADILGPSEAFRKKLDYFSQTKQLPKLMAKLIATKPTTLACMHGSAWRGDGARLLATLADALA